MSASDLARAARSIRSDRALPAGDSLSRLIDAARLGTLGAVETGLAAAPAPSAPSRRDRLWELSGNLHCSIIGTCLTTADLRTLLAKLGQPGARTMSEHALHTHAVVAAGRKDAGGKLLHKLLDRRHHRDIARLDRATDRQGVGAFWREAVERGEIAGAYWAVLTHPLTDHELVKAVFGEVHMLSHLVGRAVRADLRRMAGLEDELADRTEAVAELEARVRALTAEKVALADRLVSLERLAAVPVEPPRAETRVDEKLAQWRERLDRAEAHAVAEGGRRAALETAVAGLGERLRAATEREAALRVERDCMEAALDGQLEGGEIPASASLDGFSLLYVGGRPRQVAQARRLVEARGGTLLAHDGGKEEAIGLLAGLVGRADVVLFPVDCVSHDAALSVKRLCREGRVPLVPLRSASLAAVVAALETVGGNNVDRGPASVDAAIQTRETGTRHT